AFIRHNVQITHMIDADTDAERQLIVRELRRTNAVASVRQVRLRQPYRLINRAWRGVLQADGLMEVIHLKSS
ncbi:MAG TPA: LssY C-terminal domain-containing protein, partial [Candidatus Saccharimonadales bacterium]